MPLLKGAMGASRYRVVDPPANISRDELLERLNEGAFKEPFSSTQSGETVGWVNIHNPGDSFMVFLAAQEEVIGNLMRELGFL